METKTYTVDLDLPAISLVDLSREQRRETLERTINDVRVSFEVWLLHNDASARVTHPAQLGSTVPVFLVETTLGRGDLYKNKSVLNAFEGIKAPIQ